MNEQTYWGYHLILDCAECNNLSITSSDTIRSFVKELVPAIDMIAYGEPQIVHFGTGNKAGYTLIQLIETSNICAHFVNENNTMYLDVFSCKPFEPKIVEDLVVKYFEAKSAKVAFIKRQA
ncbi:S-adenosylmethionine decarboxylase [bacterium]|nr:S-adenosylmethionine decarboxylase [Candidatus Elulimicrobium humile]